MKIITTIIALLLCYSLAHAQNSAPVSFKTELGKQYTNVTITRIEPDGITVMTDSGVEKISFSNLPAEIQKKYGYDADKAANYASVDAQVQHQMFQANLAAAHQVEQQKDQQLLAASAATNDAQALQQGAAIARQHTIVVSFTPSAFNEDSTSGEIQPLKLVEDGVGNASSTDLSLTTSTHYAPDGDHYFGVVEGKMPDSMQAGDAITIMLYSIGHTADASRDPLYTTDLARASEYYAAGK